MLVIQVSISYLFTLSPPARNNYQSISRLVITLTALQAIFLALLASVHVDAGVSNFNPLHFNPHAIRLAPVSIPQQSRGLILDLLFGGSRGQGTTPRPVRRPGDRQDQAPSQELTGTWILGRYMITKSWIDQSLAQGILQGEFIWFQDWEDKFTLKFDRSASKWCWTSLVANQLQLVWNVKVNVQWSLKVLIFIKHTDCSAVRQLFAVQLGLHVELEDCSERQALVLVDVHRDLLHLHLPLQHLLVGLHLNQSLLSTPWRMDTQCIKQILKLRKLPNLLVEKIFALLQLLVLFKKPCGETKNKKEFEFWQKTQKRGYWKNTKHENSLKVDQSEVALWTKYEIKKRAAHVTSSWPSDCFDQTKCKKSQRWPQVDGVRACLVNRTMASLFKSRLSHLEKKFFAGRSKLSPNLNRCQFVMQARLQLSDASSKPCRLPPSLQEVALQQIPCSHALPHPFPVV